MAFTEQQKEAWINELFDPQKVQVYCGVHHYAGPNKSGGVEVKPGKNCARCWFVYYFLEIAHAPPSERAAKLDELEEVVRNISEMAAKGKFDFKPFQHAEVEFDS